MLTDDLTKLNMLAPLSSISAYDEAGYFDVGMLFKDGRTVEFSFDEPPAPANFKISVAPTSEFTSDVWSLITSIMLEIFALRGASIVKLYITYA